MAAHMQYRGNHRKYIEGTSQYTEYHYGDVVRRNGVSYVCTVPRTLGYLPEESQSGFVVIGDGVGSTVGFTGGFTGPFGGTGGINFTFGATAPASPSQGDQWFNSVDGLLYVYIIDNDSQQWIQPNQGPLSPIVDGGSYG